MKPFEEYFVDSITRYKILEREADTLIATMESLSPDQILDKCSELSCLQKEISENDERIIELIKFNGPSILDNPCTGEYQRALQRALDASDRVASKARTIKALLSEEIKGLKANRKGISGYASGNRKSGSILSSEV